ncbi:MAG: TetR family transcriptional regulator [Rhodobacteraceae bacterium]|nr:TetR family transcriptional regulator [Paracoccaceae bacterium]
MKNQSASNSKTETKTRAATNRRQELLEAAAKHFLEKGFAAASMRAIAAEANMKPGSIYYHFDSKSTLFVEVHKVGLINIKQRLETSLKGVEGGWERLEAACASHLKVLLEGDVFFQAVMSETPKQYGPTEKAQIIFHRDAYEAIFSQLLDDLDLPVGTDRRDLRLMLIGAMNWAFGWYQPGRETPEEIARKYVGFLATQLKKDKD